MAKTRAEITKRQRENRRTKARAKVPALRKDGQPDKRIGSGAPPHAFKKGWKPPYRRKKGTPNRVTVVLKECVLLAAQAVGSDGQGSGGLQGYLEVIAMQEPKSFVALLGRIIPMHVQHKPDEDQSEQLTREELKQRALERGLPSHIFDAAIPQDIVDVPAIESRLDTDAIANGDGEDEE